MPRRPFSLLVVLALLAQARGASSTTIVPPTFDDLVSRAETIFIGEVVDQRSEWEITPGGRSIVTLVTFDVARVLKGSPTVRTQLTFLGGRIDDLTMQVADMPAFRVGDRDVLFVSADHHAASPIVGFAYGRFRVTRDPVSGADVVRTHDGRPLVSTTDITSRVALALQPVAPMRLGEFESTVRQRLAALRAR